MPTILIASNDLNLVEHFHRYLEEIGDFVTILSSGSQIRKMIASLKPDLIFLDMALLEKNVFEVFHELKNDSITSKIPVVFISSRNNSLGQTWGKILGVEAFLFKPIDKEQISAVFQQLMTEYV